MTTHTAITPAAKPAISSLGKSTFQAKLRIGPANDAYEREADRTAEQVMRMPAPSGGIVQRKCAECEDEEKKLQRKEGGASSGPAVAPPVVHDVLSGSGRPLDPSLRSFMEPRFGHDFGNVRIHTDNRASESARSVNALAYTVGRDVVFGAGSYQPGTDSGRRLIAHELTHVVQQGGMDSGLQRTAGPLLQRAAIYSGKILYEGDCAHLACNSKWACEDATNGIECPDGTRNAHSTTKKKYRPLFTCDTKCENNKTCSDSGNWMAIPKSRFERSKCGQDLVICANGKFTHGTVRDRSEREAWEVSPGIIDTLGVKRATFSGAIYADENDSAFKKDKTNCGKE